MEVPRPKISYQPKGTGRVIYPPPPPPPVVSLQNNHPKLSGRMHVIGVDEKRKEEKRNKLVGLILCGGLSGHPISFPHIDLILEFVDCPDTPKKIGGCSWVDIFSSLFCPGNDRAVCLGVWGGYEGSGYRCSYPRMIGTIF